MQISGSGVPGLVITGSDEVIIEAPRGEGSVDTTDGNDSIAILIDSSLLIILTDMTISSNNGELCFTFFVHTRQCSDWAVNLKLG